MAKNKDFTLSDIQKYASGKSFSKGQEYYIEGNVGKITRNGNVYSGTVFGTEDYELSLEVNDNEMYFDCSCPYEFEGICKHCVAFALAILNHDFENVKPVKTLDSLTKEKFNTVNPEKRLDFLFNLININPDIRNQFNSYFFSDSIKTEKNGNSVETVRQDIFEQLSGIDFDDVLESSREDYHYNRYYEEIEDDIVEKEVDTVINEYFNQIEISFLSGDFISPTTIIIGLYEGCQLLPDSVGSDYDMFEIGYREFVMSKIETKFNEMIKRTENILLSEKMVEEVFHLLSDRIKVNKNSDVIMNTSDVSVAQNQINYEIGFWKPLLKKMAFSAKTANMLIEFIEVNKFNDIDSVPLILYAADLMGDPVLWYSTAEYYSDSDMETSAALISRLKKDKKNDEFEKLIIKSYNKWPDRFDNYIIEYLDKEKYKVLYIDALANYSRTKRSIKHYSMLREYLDEGKRRMFVDGFSTSYHHEFYVEMLNIEKRYEDILNFIKKVNKNGYYINSFINLIIGHLPGECYSLLKYNCTEAIESPGKDRKTYHNIVAWLLIMKKIEGYQNDVNLFVSQLYNHKPALPALRDEIRTAGLYK